MCGIAGFYGFEDKKLLKDFSEKLKHRGPDGEGMFVNSEVSLLNRRLSIIDIKGGDQPIYSEDKRMVVVYNGEIYNYKELRKELEEAGHVFNTRSDTEVIVHGYEVWGTDCFNKFNGMFAIALYDLKKKKLILARDHFGIKPLYYTLLPQKGKNRNQSDELSVQLLFSSEIKPLVTSGYLEAKPNDKAIYRYLTYRAHDDTEETFFAGIKKLMPGQMMIIEDDAVAISYYSNLENELKNLATSTLKKKELTQGTVEEFKANLIDAIRLRLISDVPVGTCLSGGLDSSSVVAIVNLLLEEKIVEARSVGASQNTFSAVFPKQSNDEERYVDAMLAQYRTLTSHKVYPTPEELFNELNDFITTQEEPMISTGPYAQYKVMQAAKKYVKVLLDGQGADEMMAGYLPYYFVYLKQLKKEKKYVKLISEIFSSWDVIGKYLRIKLHSIVHPSRAHQTVNRAFKEQFKSERFEIVKDSLKLRLIQDIFYNSLPSLLRYEDKNSMRFSIEGRVPFLDVNLVRYLFTLSDDAIIKRGWNKKILRESMKELLPSMISKRRNKIGFTTPEEAWFLRMKNRIYSLFLSESFANRPYFNQQEVVKQFQQYIEGKNTDSMLFWRLLNVEMWLRLFIDSDEQKEQTSKKEKKEIKKDLEVDGVTYTRHLIRTDLFQKGDNYHQKIIDSLGSVISASKTNTKNKSVKKSLVKKWFIVVSEKVIAIAQGRSYFIWDIKPNYAATLLSRYVTRTPYGIGLGSPWTMQLAIQEVGLPKILLATVASALTKPLGIKGTFYRIAGDDARSIDGPTEYSLYPSNVSAKLGPHDPQLVADEIKDMIMKQSNLFEKKGVKDMQLSKEGFDGVVVIDANDLGRNVLGNATSLSNATVEKIFEDNPMGQGAEQTPITIVSYV